MELTIRNSDRRLSASRREGGSVKVFLGDDLVMESKGFGAFIEDGRMTSLDIVTVSAGDGGIRLASEGGGLRMECSITAEEGESRFFRFECALANASALTREGRASVSFGVSGEGEPRWMIPAMFYKDNRPRNNDGRYPRYDFNGGDAARFVSDRWSFRSDRSSLPSVFCWRGGHTAALLTEETFSRGISGLSFRGNREGVRISLCFPYAEEPAAHVLTEGDTIATDVAAAALLPGETLSFAFRLYAADGGLHSYNVPVRELYAKMKAGNPLHPWMSLNEAEALAAHGMYRWHYDEGLRIFKDTVGFDDIVSRIAGGMDGQAQMHIAWCNGIPHAYILMRYGVRAGNEAYAEAGRNVIEKALEGMAESGIPYPRWSAGRGWYGSERVPGDPRIHARTMSEAALFLLRAYLFELAQGREHGNWREAIVKWIDFALSIQREDGSFGCYYSIGRRAVDEWDGCGGILWIPVLVEAHRHFHNEEWLYAAQRAGAYYERFVRDEYVYGAPEDVYLTPTSEDGYNAVWAYLSLYEADANTQWLELAKMGADWTMTFRWCYNVRFPDYTILGQYDFRTRGGDIASPCNNHIHNYGLIILPEMLRLYRHTGDEYYLERTADNLACFLQFIAREDGDFNAGRGMVTEHWYHTNWIRPKGSLLALSHIWCIGMALYAAMEAREPEFRDELARRVFGHGRVNET